MMDLTPFWFGRLQRHRIALKRFARNLIQISPVRALGIAGVLGAMTWQYRARLLKFPKRCQPGDGSSESLRLQTKKLDRAVLDVLPSHFCILDETGTIIAVNRAWREFARANPPIRTEVCEGANYLAVCDAAKDEPAAIECGAALRNLIAGRLLEFSREYSCHSPNEERWFTMRARRYLDDGLIRVVIAHETITGRKLAERAAVESEERYKTIVEQAFAGIAILNPQGRILLVNDMVCRLSGYSREELVRMSAVQLLPPEDHLRFADVWQKLLAGESDQSEWSILRKDGSRIPTEARVRRLTDGNLLGFVCDLSQHKEADSLRGARDTAENASRAKDQFMAMLSHELRTPLAPVLFATRVIEREKNLPESIRELGAMIQRNIELQARLIDDMLDHSRVTSGKLELQCRRVSVDEIIKRVLQTIADDFTAKRLHVQVELKASDPEVKADEARLQQILWNLLKNAIKFTSSEGTITIRTSNPKPRRLRIEVEDNGIGIPPDLLAKLFHPFEQGGAITTRRFGGLGLGLAISEKLAKLHGGTLTAHSAGEGRGATFTLEIPTAISSSIEAPLHPPQSDKPAAPSRLRILLVEDHADTARILARILEQRGHHVHISHCLHDAEAAAETEPLDLVLSDIDLPDGTGYELMQFLHDTHPLPGIAMSGFGMENDVQKSREAGFAEHLVKPVDPDRLEQVIDQVVASAG